MKTLVILLLIAGAGAGAWLKPWSSSAASEKPTQERWISVEPKLRDLSSFVLATGIVRPRVGAEVEVGSRASGILSKLHCDVGTRVEAGDLLAELDPTEFEAARKRSAAALENAKAERDYALTSYERNKNLGNKVVPLDTIDLAKRDLRVAQARLSEAAAALESSQIQLDFTRIIAPISGVVASVSTQVGETVAASFSAPTFVTIIDLERLEVWAYVDETDIGRIQVGQRASFTVDTYASSEFRGRVSAIYPKAEVRDNVVNYVVIIKILESDGKVLRPEMTATIKVLLEAEGEVLSIPNNAIRRDADGFYVMLRDPQGDPTRRGLTLGFRGRDYTEIKQGVTATERVLIAQ